jgi:GntR family transcriptional repressor for pyruvate dehydrogenase complex
MASINLSQRVEIKIKQLLAQGHLKIGDKLPPERELAEAMNVSRHTLREAIKSLERAGLLKIRPGSGTFIFGDVDEIGGIPQGIFEGAPRPSDTDVFQFRWALEPAIAAAAVDKATEAGLRVLRENLAEQEEAMARGDTAAWAQADLNFHLILSRLSGNSLFIAVIEKLSDCIAMCVDASHLNPARMRLYYEGHFSVYQAVVDRNLKRAIFHMEEHLKHLPWQENLKISAPMR